jgi:hypothetical protein
MNKSSAKSSSRSNTKKLQQNKKPNDGLTIQEEMNIGNKLKRMKGRIIGETDKALRVTIDNGEDIWIPKSIIKSQYNTETNSKQTFLIDSWFLEKNNLLLQTA